MKYLNILYFLLFYISQIFSIISILYHGLGYFIFLVNNDIQIDLLKIKNKKVRYIVESFLIIKNIDKIKKDSLKRAYYNRFLFSLIMLLIIPILIYFETKY